ncbi:MAG: hypothetical protein RL757_200 [Bacteroidota bacterium]|jgi:gliding motility-associated-like protein
MKKIIFLNNFNKILLFLFLIIFNFLKIENLNAQQIKRQTLGSSGRVRTQGNFRISHTFGSCPGCNTLHPNTPTDAGYLRQGFQQPPNTDESSNTPNCRDIFAAFSILRNTTTNCGSNYDFEFNGSSPMGMTFRWTFGDGAIPQTSTDLNPLGVNYATAGLKYVVLEIRKDGCTKSLVKTINVGTTELGFAAVATVTNLKCRGAATGAIALQSTMTATTAGATYRWSNGATTQNVGNLAAGRYQVTMTNDAANCRFVLDTVVKQPDSLFKIVATTRAESCKGFNDGFININYRNATPPVRIVWADANTNSFSRDSLRNGRYRLTLTDSNACKLDTAIAVGIRCDTVGRTMGNGLPDIISPNSDGANDTWTVPNIENYPKNVLFIYNRWGEVVYARQPYGNEWSGQNDKGQALPSGAYYYVLELNDDKNTVYTGSITLVR